MQVEFNNIQDNLIYHANIFNYDKAFLLELISIRLKLDFIDYPKEGQTREEEIANISEFLKLKSKEQIEKLNTILDEESGIIFDNENEPVKKVKKQLKQLEQ